MGDWKSALSGLKTKMTANEKVEDVHLKAGSVIYVPLEESDGLTLKAGDAERNKYIVIIGVTKDGCLIGSLLINTDPRNYTTELADCQYLVRKSKYPSILDYDSWLNCGAIFELDRAKLKLKGSFKGKLDEDDFEYIMQFLRDTNMYTPKEKRKYGIIE